MIRCTMSSAGSQSAISGGNRKPWRRSAVRKKRAMVSFGKTENNAETENQITAATARTTPPPTPLKTLSIQIEQQAPYREIRARTRLSRYESNGHYSTATIKTGTTRDTNPASQPYWAGLVQSETSFCTAPFLQALCAHSLPRSTGGLLHLPEP